MNVNVWNSLPANVDFSSLSKFKQSIIKVNFSVPEVQCSITMSMSYTILILFSPLGKLADRAIYFACVNFFLFFFNDRSETN